MNKRKQRRINQGNATTRKLRNLSSTDAGVYLDGCNNKPKAMPYDRYLLTGHWRRARAHAIKLSDGRCTICQNDRNLHVHHLDYRSLWNERYNDVVVLCEVCHDNLHMAQKRSAPSTPPNR